jgi:hypothetical protein
MPGLSVNNPISRNLPARPYPIPPPVSLTRIFRRGAMRGKVGVTRRMDSLVRWDEWIGGGDE